MKSKTSINPFALFLLGAVLIAGLLGALGLYIYRKNGSYALDLSRPDYKPARQDIRYTAENDRIRVNREGKVDKKFAEEVNESLQKYLEQISQEAFAERAISDEALGIITEGID